jgi:hypothetical protein
MRMAKKRTKADKLQRNVERLATRDDAVREKSEITDRRSEPTSKTPGLTERESEAEILDKKTAIGTPRKPAA